ncbi:MAG: hypothetical protein IT494_08905 [Gammaproteobacteria bacterium]|nr:hypothetical protein [Gammaproteobacteria bacterium]
MDFWLKLATALFLGLMVVLLLPVAKRMQQQSPEAKPGDWHAALVPVALVVLFVLLLVRCS